MGARCSVVILVVAAVLAAGCATAARAIDPRVATHEYEGSVAALTQRTAAFLEEQGYALREVERRSDCTLLRTKWRFVLEAKRASQSLRYVALVRQTRPGRATIQLARISRTTVGMAGFHPHQSTRDSKATATQGGEGADGMGSGEPLRANPDIVARDLELEWELLRTLEPESAHALAVSRPGVRPVLARAR